MKNGLKMLRLAGVAVAGLASAGWAQGEFVVRSSYPVAAAEPIRMFTNSASCLPGRGGPGSDSKAARVEIRAVKRPGAVPVAPTAEGVSDEEANPLIAVTRIGAGTVGARPGRFAVCIPHDALIQTVPVGETTASEYYGYFARVYDQPTVEDSTYYVDSNVVYYNPDQYFTNMVFAKSMTPIDGATADKDSDDDGLLDQYESEYGTDYLNPDTDGDGLLDGVEIAYGLDPLSPSLLISDLTADRSDPTISDVLPSESQMHVEWPASTNPLVKYTLQLVGAVGDWPENGGDTNYVLSIPVGAVSQTNWAEDVTPYLTNLPMGFFRLSLDLEPLPDSTGE